jgi:hypothetical protein
MILPNIWKNKIDVPIHQPDKPDKPDKPGTSGPFSRHQPSFMDGKVHQIFSSRHRPPACLFILLRRSHTSSLSCSLACPKVFEEDFPENCIPNKAKNPEKMFHDVSIHLWIQPIGKAR